MELEMDIRSIKDFRTDAWLEVSCHSGNSTSKLPCEKSTVDTLHNNMMHRDFFNFSAYYKVTNDFMVWMWTLTGIANTLIFGADSRNINGAGTGNMCAVTLGDALELHNYFALYNKVGRKYGYVKPEKHLLGAESRHDNKGGYRSNMRTQKYYYQMHKLN